MPVTQTLFFITKETVLKRVDGLQIISGSATQGVILHQNLHSDCIASYKYKNIIITEVEQQTKHFSTKLEPYERQVNYFFQMFIGGHTRLKLVHISQRLYHNYNDS